MSSGPTLASYSPARVAPQTPGSSAAAPKTPMSSGDQPTPDGVNSHDSEEVLTALAEARNLARNEQTLTLHQVYAACQEQMAALKERADLGADRSGVSRDALPVPRPDHVSAGASGGRPSAPDRHRDRAEPRESVSRDRSRAPAPRTNEVCWSTWVDDLYDDDGVGDVLEAVPEEDVGNLLDLSVGDLGCRGTGSFDPSTVQTGCFASLAGTEESWEPLPEGKHLGANHDFESYFCQP